MDNQTNPINPSPDKKIIQPPGQNQDKKLTNETPSGLKVEGEQEHIAGKKTINPLLQPVDEVKTTPSKAAPLQGPPSPPPPKKHSPLPQLPPTPNAKVSNQVVSPPAQVVAHSYDDPNGKVEEPKKINPALLITGGAVLILLIILATYFLVLPSTWSSSYTKSIKPAYDQQADQMVAVYLSINRPVFTSSNSSQATNTQDLAYINGVLETAASNTDNLQAKNKLIVLPATTWLGSVSKANNVYQNMQQYLLDSQNFLTDYQTLTTYVTKIKKIGDSLLPSMQPDINNIDSSENNSANAIVACQKMISDVQKFQTQIKSLTPSPDLKEFNSNLLTDTTGMINGLTGLVVTFQSTPSIQTYESVAEFDASAYGFIQLLQSNPTANIATSSVLYGQILDLQKEKPLG